MSRETVPHYREFLKSSLESRKKKNPGYSMRAFAKSVGCDPSFFCKILAGNKHMSLSLAKKIVEKLDLPLDQKKTFLASVAQDMHDRALREVSKSLGQSDFLLDGQNQPPLDIGKFEENEVSLNSKTLSIDPSRLPEARRMIERFILELSDFLEQGTCSRSYELGLQLIPSDLADRAPAQSLSDGASSDGIISRPDSQDSRGAQMALD